MDLCLRKIILLFRGLCDFIQLQITYINKVGSIKLEKWYMASFGFSYLIQLITFSSLTLSDLFWNFFLLWHKIYQSAVTPWSFREVFSREFGAASYIIQLFSVQFSFYIEEHIVWWMVVTRGWAWYCLSDSTLSPLRTASSDSPLTNYDHLLPLLCVPRAQNACKVPAMEIGSGFREAVLWLLQLIIRIKLFHEFL